MGDDNITRSTARPNVHAEDAHSSRHPSVDDQQQGAQAPTLHPRHPPPTCTSCPHAATCCSTYRASRNQQQPPTHLNNHRSTRLILSAPFLLAIPPLVTDASLPHHLASSCCLITPLLAARLVVGRGCLHILLRGNKRVGVLLCGDDRTDDPCRRRKPRHLAVTIPEQGQRWQRRCRGHSNGHLQVRRRTQARAS